MRKITWTHHWRESWQFYHINYINLDSGFTFEAHTHKNFIEIIYVVTGQLQQVMNGSSVCHESGTLMLLRPTDHHEIIGGQGQSAVLRVNSEFISNFEQLVASDTLLERLLEAESVPTTTLPAEDQQTFENLLRTLSSCAEEARSNLLLTRILALILDDYFYHLLNQPNSNTKLPAWLNSLLIILQRQDASKLKVSDLPTVSGYTSEHIARTFKKHLNISPSAYINDLKLEFAAKMLSSTNEPLLNVCYESGFENAGYFHKLFKEKYGLTPNKYRKSILFS